jgi:hypothetical protein
LISICETIVRIQSIGYGAIFQREKRMSSKKLVEEAGQSLVEFSISAILIILLLVAVADFGRAFFTYLSMRDAAQEGALYGAICPRHVTRIEERVRSTGNLPVNLADDTQVNFDCYYQHDIDGDGEIEPGESWRCTSGVTPLPGYGIRIEVLYPNFVITTPLLGSIIGNSISLRAEVIDTILRVPDIDPLQACP